MQPRTRLKALTLQLIASSSCVAVVGLAEAQQSAQAALGTDNSGEPREDAPVTDDPVLDTWGTSPDSEAPALPPSPPSEPLVKDLPRGDPPNVSTLSSDAAELTRVRYHLERIEVRGNARTRPGVILRYLPFHVNGEVDPADVEFTLARYRLLGTGFFREVDFSLRKGSKRGSVVLVVDVVERNTVVVNGIWMGLSKDADRNGNDRQLSAYGGIDIAETNLAGTGITLGGAVGFGGADKNAPGQYAVHVRALHPGFLSTPWMLSLSLLHNRATDFFHTDGLSWGPNDNAGSDYALLPYQRFGGSVGIGRDLSVSTQLWFHYRLETISAEVPLYARHLRGGRRESIEFDILKGRSVFSTVRANFQVDTRDHPFLPTRGWYVSTWGELGLLPLGSNYDFQRFDVSASYYWHKRDSSSVWQLQLFAGAMTGNVPFFEQYYVGDFSDFRPPRMLSLNVDARRSPNLLGTAIDEVRYGHFAAQIAGEYRLPVYRGHRSVYGIDFFLRAGLFAVAHRRDLTDPAPDKHGLQRIPFDLTANMGFRMDTTVGGVIFSVSNVLGFLPGAGGE